MIYVDSRDDDALAIYIHVVEEPQAGEDRGTPLTSVSFRYDLEENDPFVAATMVLRWVNHLKAT